MSKVLVTEEYMTDLGDAIREKNGTSNHYKPNQMGAAVRALPDPSVLVPKTIIQNGNYDPDDDNADGYSSVAVNVPNSYEASDEGKVVSNGALVAQTSVTVTENGTVDTTTNDEVVVNVSGGGSDIIPGAVRLTPYKTDDATGYVSSGRWYSYQQNYNDCRSDFYEIPASQSGERYILIFVASGGDNRFRIMVANQNPEELTPGVSASIVGNQLTNMATNVAQIDVDDRIGYTGGLFKVTGLSVKRYLFIGKTNRNVNGIKTYVIDVGDVS